MSLLMDALKKAELAKKRQAAQDATAPQAPDSALELEPLDLASPPAEGELATHASSIEPLSGTGGDTLPAADLELLDQEFMDQVALTQPAPPPEIEPPDSLMDAPRPAAQGEPAQAMVRRAPKPAAPPDTSQQREAIQNLFEAKQAPPSRKAFVMLTGIFAVLAIAGIGLYVWLQTQPHSSLLKPVGTQPKPETPQPLAAVPAAAPPSAGPSTPAAADAGPAVPNAEEKAAPKAREREPEARAPTAQVAPPASPIRVSTAKPRTDPTIDNAYAALQDGRLDSAQIGYERALKDDPRNADALHGLATVHQRRGQPDQAAEYYSRALEADPRDAIAQAGLIGISDQTDPVQSESRLKQLLAAQPDSPFLHFSLGNLYARQARWPEAQQQYFKAMSGDPDNPDYLFNLAVSLDQMHQNALALQYYQSAVVAAEKRPAGFERAQVLDRLKKLQP